MLEIAKWSDRKLGDRVFIPEDRRGLLEMPPDVVAKALRKQLAAWEDAFLEPGRDGARPG
jgi:hypothetical protein